PPCANSATAGSKSCGTACAWAAPTTKPSTQPTATAHSTTRPEVDRGCLIGVSPWVEAVMGQDSRARQHVQEPGSRRHRWSATAFVLPGTYLAGLSPREYVATSDSGQDSGALGEPGQLRAAVAGLHEKPFHV